MAQDDSEGVFGGDGSVKWVVDVGNARAGSIQSNSKPNKGHYQEGKNETADAARFTIMIELPQNPGEELAAPTLIPETANQQMFYEERAFTRRTVMIQFPMTEEIRRNKVPERAKIEPEAKVEPEPLLLSDEPTIELVVRARGGDRGAMEALLERCLPPLKRWAHGRLPAAARGNLDTGDLVQEATLHILGNLDTFEPRHVGAMQAYLRQSVINRIRDEVRRFGRQPPPLELPEDHPSDRTSPLEIAIQAEAYQRYRNALTRLGARDREMIVARIEVQWSLAEIAHRFGLRTVDAARMAVSRAVKRLTQDLARH